MDLNERVCFYFLILAKEIQEKAHCEDSTSFIGGLHYCVRHSRNRPKGPMFLQ